MGRISVLILLVMAMSLPVLAAGKPDCAIWEIRGIMPGMTVEQATVGREFETFEHPKDPPGYLRYVSYSKTAAAKLDMHVDVLADPPRVIGIGTTRMKSQTPPKLYFEQLMDKWGEPVDVFKNGQLTVYTWTSAECEVDARVTVMNRDGVIGVFSAMTSMPGLWELKRRGREARAAAAAEAAPPEPMPDDASADGDRKSEDGDNPG